MRAGSWEAFRLTERYRRGRPRLPTKASLLSVDELCASRARFLALSRFPRDGGFSIMRCCALRRLPYIMLIGDGSMATEGRRSRGLGCTARAMHAAAPPLLGFIRYRSETRRYDDSDAFGLHARFSGEMPPEISGIFDICIFKDISYQAALRVNTTAFSPPAADTTIVVSAWRHQTTQLRFRLGRHDTERDVRLPCHTGCFLLILRLRFRRSY